MGDPLRDSREAKIFIKMNRIIWVHNFIYLEIYKNFRKIRNIRDMYSKYKIGFLRFFGLNSKLL